LNEADGSFSELDTNANKPHTHVDRRGSLYFPGPALCQCVCIDAWQAGPPIKAVIESGASESVKRPGCIHGSSSCLTHGSPDQQKTTQGMLALIKPPSLDVVVVTVPHLLVVLVAPRMWTSECISECISKGCMPEQYSVFVSFGIARNEELYSIVAAQTIPTNPPLVILLDPHHAVCNGRKESWHLLLSTQKSPRLLYATLFGAM